MFPCWYDPINLGSHPGGRLWLSWDGNYFKVEILGESAQMVVCHITYKPLNRIFFGSFVYGLNARELRMGLWEEMRSWNRSIHSPWLLTGDFNAILEFKDTQGGNRVKIQELTDFRECVADCCLEDLNSAGCYYT